MAAWLEKRAGDSRSHVDVGLTVDELKGPPPPRELRSNATRRFARFARSGFAIINNRQRDN